MRMNGGKKKQNRIPLRGMRLLPFTAVVAMEGPYGLFFVNE